MAAHCAWLQPWEAPPDYPGNSPYMETGYWLKPADMISDRDIYAAAAMLIKVRGEEALRIAETRAVVLKAAGNEVGYAAVTRIVEAIKELGRNRPGSDETRH